MAYTITDRSLTLVEILIILNTKKNESGIFVALYIVENPEEDFKKYMSAILLSVLTSCADYSYST